MISPERGDEREVDDLHDAVRIVGLDRRVVRLVARHAVQIAPDAERIAGLAADSE